MKRLNWQHVILSGTLVLSLGACSHKPTKMMKTGIPFEIPSSPPQHMVLLQEARSEAENMRAELASLKILMAKQAGEIRSLRERSQSVQHREQGQGLELQNIRSQLLTTQAERDQLQKQNIELEAQAVDTPDTTQLVTDIQSLRGSFQQIVSNMKGLVSDMRLIKHEMHIPTEKAKPRQMKMAANTPLVTIDDKEPLNIKQTLDAMGRIIIEDGDTLLRLSRTYHVSVTQLREWNNLTSDLIFTGFPLKVAEPSKTFDVRPTQVNAPPELTVPAAQEENIDNMVQENPQPSFDSHVKIPSEPKHILSIGGSQSDTPESP